MADQFRIGQVIDRLVALSRASAGHRAPDGTDSTTGLVTVYDGPEVRATDDAEDNTFLIIGWSGDLDDGLTPAGAGAWKAGPIANQVRPRDESTAVTCKVVSQRGESPKLARDAAIAEVALIAGLCRSDPTLGVDSSATIGGVRTRAFVTAGTMVQYLAKGYVCELDFEVYYDARV
jgi:hypothetical protein